MSASPAHDALFPAVETWLRQNGRPHSMREPSRGIAGNSGACIPDILAWGDNPGPTFASVDVKVSLSDARAHLDKPHVREPRLGVGRLRYLACPADLGAIPLPDRWGLLHVSDGGVVEVSAPEFFRARDYYAEMWMIQRSKGSPARSSKRESTSPVRNAMAIMQAVQELGGFANVQNVARHLGMDKTQRVAMSKAIESNRVPGVRFGVGRMLETVEVAA